MAFENSDGGCPGVASAAAPALFIYLRLQQGQVWMLTMYVKNEADSISGPVLRKIKEALDGQD